MFRPDNPVDFAGFEARALIDTGATVSGIGPRVVAALGLRSYGKKPLGSATEERMMDYYLFRLGFPADPQGQPSWPFIFERVDGFSWSRDTTFDVILGMDILLQCDLRLERAGRCRLNFGET